MSTSLGPPRTRRPRRPSRARRARRAAFRLLVAAALVAAGVAVGQALSDDGTPGGTQTIVRRLRPLPLPPAVATVTVTTTRTDRQP